MSALAPLDPQLAGFTVDDPARIPADVNEPLLIPTDLELLLPLDAPLPELAASGSVSGLSDQHRAAAKTAAVAAARVALEKRDRVHYTQGPERWDGIAHNRYSRRGDFPRNADCSAFVTWCIYQGVRFYRLRDTVNGEDWKAGFTGTMLGHGKPVAHEQHIQHGDAAIYGTPGTTGAHTVLCVGGGLVISHGSEAGPFLLPIHYRSDLLCVRRYI